MFQCTWTMHMVTPVRSCQWLVAVFPYSFYEPTEQFYSSLSCPLNIGQLSKTCCYNFFSHPCSHIPMCSILVYYTVVRVLSFRMMGCCCVWCECCQVSTCYGSVVCVCFAATDAGEDLTSFYKYFSHCTLLMCLLNL